MFDRILIANRGEIACRVAATARRLGVRTVAVYSDADADAQHVAACDVAVRLGPAPARDSYLRGEAILAAARATGAQAVHPGYGFLSENAAFAQACGQAGLVFIGPPPGAIRAMGSKSAAKAIMAAAHVPLVPGYHGEEQAADFLRAQADALGYPVLIKASSGGGGKGMRVVEASAAFEAALASCRREAAASFGDDQVLLERYLAQPRHIEIQVFADAHGNALSLFERDCSVQRRHQKVLEEAPAPGMTAERRRAMGEAAVSAARAVGYVGAGTVEFIVAPDGTFYFMEMNTRLQVEHPVTEMVTGHDLVEWQLRVAAGEPLTDWLPGLAGDLQLHGHAIEARLYAENPDNGFLPSTGRLKHLALPPHVAFQRNADANGLHDPAPVRVDGGVRAGDVISPHYDPMIAKLIVWGADRAQALAHLRTALAATRVVGVASNVDFLARVAENPAFVQGRLDTGLIECQRALLFPSAQPLDDLWFAAAVARLLADEAAARDADPWSDARGWRLNGVTVRRLRLRVGRDEQAVAVAYERGGTALLIDERRIALTVAVQGAGEPGQLRTTDGSALRSTDATALRPTALRLRVGDRALTTHVVRDGDDLHVFIDGRHRVLTLLDPIAHAGEAEADAGSLAAPMPGKVVAVLAAAGAQVEKGAPLLVMEAMKMEHTIVAPADGTLEAVLYAAGDQVAEGAELVRFAISARP